MLEVLLQCPLSAFISCHSDHTTQQGRATHKHSHIADMGQERADQAFVFTADVLLKRALQPVLNVAHLQDHAGVPTNS